MPRSAKYSEAEAKAAKLESNAKHQREKLDRIVIQPEKEIGAEIRKAAQLSGQSLQGYILQAIRERMVRDASPVLDSETAK